MDEFIANYKPLAEFLSYIATIIVAFFAIYGVRQVFLLKQDMDTRNERSAKEKAIEFSGRFLSIFTPLINQFFLDWEAAKLKDYVGPIGDFSINSIPESELENAYKIFEIFSWLPALNELNAISAAFVSGVADESLGFNTMGRDFCASVANNYCILAICRQENALNYFQSIIDLYHLWAPRISKAELEATRNQLNDRISNINVHQILPIGMSKRKKQSSV